MHFKNYVYVMGADHDFGFESDNPFFTQTLLDLTTSYLYRHLMAGYAFPKTAA